MKNPLVQPTATTLPPPPLWHYNNTWKAFTYNCFTSSYSSSTAPEPFQNYTFAILETSHYWHTTILLLPCYCPTSVWHLLLINRPWSAHNCHAAVSNPSPKHPTGAPQLPCNCLSAAAPQLFWNSTTATQLLNHNFNTPQVPRKFLQLPITVITTLQLPPQLPQ